VKGQNNGREKLWQLSLSRGIDNKHVLAAKKEYTNKKPCFMSGPFRDVIKNTCLELVNAEERVSSESK
jgi:hypothetical protein